MKKCFFNLIGISTLLCFVAVPAWAADECEKCKACCYNTPEDLKHQECCELNDKYEFVSSFEEDGTTLRDQSMCCVKDLPYQAGTSTVTETCCGGLDGTNERNGNTWVSLVPSDTDEDKCCKAGTYRNFKGDLTASCCVSYGVTEIGRAPDNTHYVKTEKFCAFVQNPRTGETACCAKESSRECGAGVPYDPKCVIKIEPKRDDLPAKKIDCNPRKDTNLPSNKLCCLAAGGVIVEGIKGSWICCTTFGVRKIGETDCHKKDGISDDFNSTPDIVIVQ